MRNRNKPHKIRAGKYSAEFHRGWRRLEKQFGDIHEDIHKRLHGSAIPHIGKRKMCRVIGIPEFQGWIFFEDNKYWGVIAPRGRMGGKKVCDVLEFRGESVDVMPVGKETPELLARRLLSIIRSGADSTQGQPGRGVVLRQCKQFGKCTVIGIRKKPPRVWGSDVAEQTWLLATAFCRRFQHHLGTPDDYVREVSPRQIPAENTLISPPR